MLKILVITNDFDKWINHIRTQVNINKEKRTKLETVLSNDLFYFSLRYGIRESDRGAAWSHVILDKEIDYELIRNVLMPTIKQHITRSTNLPNL